MTTWGKNAYLYVNDTHTSFLWVSRAHRTFRYTTQRSRPSVFPRAPRAFRPLVVSGRDGGWGARDLLGFITLVRFMVTTRQINEGVWHVFTPLFYLAPQESSSPTHKKFTLTAVTRGYRMRHSREIKNFIEFVSDIVSSPRNLPAPEILAFLTFKFYVFVRSEFSTTTLSQSTGLVLD